MPVVEMSCVQNKTHSRCIVAERMPNAFADDARAPHTTILVIMDSYEYGIPEALESLIVHGESCPPLTFAPVDIPVP